LPDTTPLDYYLWGIWKSSLWNKIVSGRRANRLHLHCYSTDQKWWCEVHREL